MGKQHKPNRRRLAAILSRHEGYTDIGVAVETGIMQCSTTHVLSKVFREVHAVELSRILYDQGKVRCEEEWGRENITFHLGDSAELLPSLAEWIQEPTLFYLDAHACKGPNIAQNRPFPLWGELMCIRKRPYADVILVDDAKDFGGRGTGPKKYWTDVTTESLAEALDPATVVESCVIGRWGALWRTDRTEAK